ncbi:MAG: sugar phosphate isomerase/epimerase family protein [Verrucomicrobiales bacterium]
MNTILDRRQFLVASGATAASLFSPRPGTAMSPLERKGDAVFKLSLAAYSFRGLLPNYRKGGPRGDEPLDMLGFVDYCASLGLDGAEITSYFLPDPCPLELALQIKRRAHIQGLSISGGAIGNNFAFPQGEELDEQFAYTERWIKTYAAMGAPVIRVFGGKPKGKGAVDEEAEANIVTNLKRACEIASKHGVILALENHDFMTDIDRFLRIVEAVESPWFAVNLDSGNFAPTPDPYAEFARAVPYAVNVQVKVEIPRNGVREPADFAKLASILREGNYRGYVVLEYESDVDPYAEIPRHIESLRKVLA